jgi:23S rRNA (adenine1618-N6)-methyltransferase
VRSEELYRVTTPARDPGHHRDLFNPAHVSTTLTWTTIMHERNPYKTPPDFESLALAYPPLRPQSVSLSLPSGVGFAFVFTPPHIALSTRPRTGCPQLTFITKPPKGQPKSPPLLLCCFASHLLHRRLTQALLHRDFGIQLEIPNDRLCPPVPNR